MAAPKTPAPILAELREFVANIPRDTPYQDLLPMAEKAGYRYVLNQTDAVGQADGTVLVTFQVLVGGADRLEPFDVISIKVGNAPGPVSLAARVLALPTIVYLFFNRLPPPQVQQAPVGVDMSQANGRDVVLPETPAEEAEDRGFVPPRRAPEPRLDLIERREPDGVPIFIDLFAMDGPLEGVPTEEIVKTLVEDMDAFARSADSPEQLYAVYTKNPDIMAFMQDFGTDESRLELNKVFERRSKQLEADANPVMTKIPNSGPRRRRSGSIAH